MKPIDTIAHIKALHAAYEARTGFTLRLNMMRERVWYDWCVWSDWQWTETDLARVIAYLRNRISQRERNEGALKFDNLIGSPDRFEEDLNLAQESAKNAQVYKPKSRSVVPETPAADDVASADYFKSMMQRP